MIDISKMDQADVLAALFNNSKQLGMGFLHGTPPVLDTQSARELIEKQGTYFDYLHGKVMKVEVSGPELNPNLYDRDNGAGAADRALDQLR